MKSESQSFEAEFNAALDRWHSGDPEGAIEALEALCREHPNEAPIHGMLGGYLYEQGALREALSHTRRAVELSPSSELAARDHFHVLYDLGLLSEAREELLRFQSRTQSVELRREWSRLIAEVDSHLFDRT